MNRNEKIKELISRYVDGEVTSEEKLKAEKYLEESPSLRTYYQELKKLSNVMNSIKPETTSPDWEESALQSLLEAQTKERPTMKEKPEKKKPRRSVHLVEVMIILFIVAVGFAFIMPATFKAKSSARIAALQTRDYRETERQYRLEDTDDMNFPTSYTKNEGKEVGALSEIKFREIPVVVTETKGPRKDLEAIKLGKALGKPEPEKSLSKIDSLAPNLSDQKKKAVYRRISKSDKGQHKPADLSLTVSENNPRVEGRIKTHGVRGIMNYNEPKEEMVLDYEGDESWRYNGNFNTEQYDRIYENEFKDVSENPLSTFSIDVDTASYSNARRFLNSGQLPPADAVRIEEMVNYFSYEYAKPEGEDPFSINIDGAICPWNTEHQLVRIGLQGKTFESESIPPSNLVFLIDVSGSMSSPDKLPLLKTAFKMMVKQLSSEERVAIVVYAGAAGQVLESTPGSNKAKILDAIDRLSSGGSTAGGAGINLAYKIASENFIKGGNNRVILATDGDFNVGTSSDGDLVRLIENKRKENVFLTVLSFGTGNLKDSKMEKLANKGNGNYYYIDTQREAKKVLVQELGSTLFTIAKDVKIQIEFNPATVKAYRLVGYENRLLAKEDFNDDTKDAGELGAGHTVTAFYEIIPATSEENVRKTDELKYQKANVVESTDLMTVKLRYKKPDEDVSKLLSQTISSEDLRENVSGDFQFAAAVAEFSHLLRNSKFKGTASYDHVLQSAKESIGKDPFGYRNEFIRLVEQARTLDTRDLSVDEPSGGIQFKN